MSLYDTFKEISRVCSENYIDEPQIVGGIPRDIYLGREAEFRDVDLTTNNHDIARLAITVAYELDQNFKVFPDSHISIYLDDATLDFSSHYVSGDIVSYLSDELDIVNPKFFEIYSRDFTINTLHKSLLTNDITDPTGKGFDDLDSKVVRTVGPADITLKDDMRRMFRAINFAARLGFTIDPDIIKFAKDNRDMYTGENRWVLKESFLTSIVGESIGINPDLTMDYLQEMDLLSVVPMVGLFKEQLIERKLVNKYLDDAINMTKYDLDRMYNATY